MGLPPPRPTGPPPRLRLYIPPRAHGCEPGSWYWPSTPHLPHTSPAVKSVPRSKHILRRIPRRSPHVATAFHGFLVFLSHPPVLEGCRLPSVPWKQVPGSGHPPGPGLGGVGVLPVHPPPSPSGEDSLLPCAGTPRASIKGGRLGQSHVTQGVLAQEMGNPSWHLHPIVPGVV